MTQSSHYHDNPITRLVGRLRRNSEGTDGKDHPEKRMRKMIRTPSLRSSKHSSPDKAAAITSPRSKSHVVADANISLGLWNAAYDSLRDRSASAGLVIAYESIVAQELPEHRKIGGINTTLRDHPDSMRLELVSSIASSGLRKRRASKASDVDEAARAILDSAKDTVELMLNAYPSTSLAWCGICALTPLLLDPLIQKQDIRSGVLYVAGRISFYMFLSQLLLPESWKSDKDFKCRQQEIRDMVLNLYRRVLEFEMNCVCATAISWNMAAKNVVDWQGLVKMDQGIREDNEALGKYIREHCTDAVAMRLLALDRDLEVPPPSTASSSAPPDGPQKLADAGAPSSGPSSAGFTQIKA